MNSPRSGKRKPQSGQALVMVTMALIAMCGVLGLAVDLGWSFYVKKTAQSAADSAALAAVTATEKLGLSPPFTCGNTSTTINCSGTPVSCPTSGKLTGNLNSACVYAALNGFPEGGNVDVTVQAGVTSPAPTVPGVKVEYWVTVRVNQQIPQLFSAVLGNSTGLVSARATAALTNIIFNASLDLLDRENDPSPGLGGAGINMKLQGGGTVTAPGGILVASNLNQNSSANSAVNLGGSANVAGTPFSLFRGALGSCASGNNGNPNCSASNWQNQLPTYGVADGKGFQDPTTQGNARTQPPLDTTTLMDDVPVKGGTIAPGTGVSSGSGTANDPCRLKPGKYYATDNLGVATGVQLTFGCQYTIFDDSLGHGSTSFGQYIFFGGLQTGGGNQTITFAAGRYVFAGTCASCAVGSTAQFTIDNGTTLVDATGAGSQSSQTNGGELFIFTNSNYNWASGSTPDGVTTWPSGGLQSTSMIPDAIMTFGVNRFDYGQGGILVRGGNNQNTSLILSGLNPSGANVPANLTNYEPFLWWQDRANSGIIYNTDGSIMTSGFGCVNEVPAQSPSINNPCLNTLKDRNSPQMNLAATPNTHMNGYIYQPRGAWLSLQGGGVLSGPLRIITGGLITGGGPTVTLTGLSTPITILETALIE